MSNNDKYNYKIYNIKNWRKELNKEVLDKTIEYQKKYGFDIGTGENATWNNEADAFKHALMQAIIFFRSGGMESIAKAAGNYHELEGTISNQPDYEKNMDLWNNRIGREIASEVYKELKWKNLGKEKDQKEFEDLVAKKIYEKMQNGEMITNPHTDTRKYKDFDKQFGKTSSMPPDKIRHFEPPYTRGDIGDMTPNEFRYYEKTIMKEMESGKIIDDKRPTSVIKEQKKEQYKNNNRGIGTNNRSSNNNDGHWVTINGNHVLID